MFDTDDLWFFMRGKLFNDGKNSKRNLFQGVNNFHDLVDMMRKVKGAYVENINSKEGGILKKYNIYIGLSKVVIEYLDFGRYQKQLQFSLFKEGKTTHSFVSIDDFLQLLEREKSQRDRNRKRGKSMPMSLEYPILQYISK